MFDVLDDFLAVLVTMYSQWASLLGTLENPQALAHQSKAYSCFEYLKKPIKATTTGELPFKQGRLDN